MKDDIQIISQEIDRETGLLRLKAKGRVVRPIANHKLRILAVFSMERMVRRFPIEAVCTDGDNSILFEIEEEISLSDVFFDVGSYPDDDYNYGIDEDGDACTMHSRRSVARNEVLVHFEYCDAKGYWVEFSKTLNLDGRLFHKKETGKSFGRRFLQKTAYVFCTLLLPVWLFDGYLVVKGKKTSPYVDKEIKGKKGMFYHAQGIVKKLTGYGYSMRELKTGYFAKQYLAACRKAAKPEGILFLSERETDVGGNLDFIRQGVQKEGLPWEEFIDTRPVDKLPFAELRRAAKMAAGAKVIILEDFYPQIHAIELRKETRLLQLWHACGAFKMFGLSDIGKVNNLRQDTKNHRNYSAAFVSGKHMVPFYSEAFGISPDKVLPLGVPRTDIFFDEDYKRQIHEKLFTKYPVLCGKKVVLFAPTFRGSGNKRAYYPAERFSVEEFLESAPEDTVLILKNHPFVKQTFSVPEKYRDKVLDLTGRENINDVLFITDLLITDYSSCIFEAALLAVPMLFYVFDLEEYVKGRDIYFDFASFAPGSQVKTFEELLSEVDRFLQGEAGSQHEHSGEKRREFCEYFLDSLDGHSTERILAYIRELCMGGVILVTE